MRKIYYYIEKLGEKRMSSIADLYLEGMGYGKSTPYASLKKGG